MVVVLPHFPPPPPSSTLPGPTSTHSPSSFPLTLLHNPELTSLIGYVNLPAATTSGLNQPDFRGRENKIITPPSRVLAEYRRLGRSSLWSQVRPQEPRGTHRQQPEGGRDSHSLEGNSNTLKKEEEECLHGIVFPLGVMPHKTHIH